MTALINLDGNSSRRGSRRAERVGYRHALANRHLISQDRLTAKFAGPAHHSVGSFRVRPQHDPNHATDWQELCPLIRSIRCTP